MSIWEDVKLPQFPQLNGNIRTDVLVVGGGIAGLLTAYELTASGVNCVVVERNRICGGATSATTAKITSQHRLIYADIAQKYGLERAAMYLAANQRAIRKFAVLSHKFRCDFEETDSFVYSRTDRHTLEREMKTLGRLHFPAELHDKLPICDVADEQNNGKSFAQEIRKHSILPFEIAGTLNFPRQAQLHPLKFLSQLAATLSIYENTPITDIRGNIAFTPNGEIHAEKIVIATHFPIIDRFGGYYLKMYQSRSSVIAFENAPKFNGYYIDANPNGLNFRNYRELTLLSGGAHRTGTPCQKEKLVRFVQLAYPKSKIVSSWSTQDCITPDKIPFIGNYGLVKSNLFVTTGFNKWGMTSAMAGAEILRDMILDKENQFAEVFSTNRSIFAKQTMINGLTAVKNLAAPKAPRCKHLGCALVYNSAEHSWDCPCHGSRYDEQGNIIDSPTTRNINVPDK